MKKRLKANSVYLDRETGRLGVLIRGKNLFRSTKRKTSWRVDFGHSILLEEFNFHFRQILGNDFEYLGDL